MDINFSTSFFLIQFFVNFAAILMEDSHRHKGLRRRLVAELREKGVTDIEVLGAMMNVPRHFFLDNAFLHFAYEDKAFPIGAGQTISQPFTVAFQTQLLNLKPGQKVLEIGTGSGYQTAVLCELRAKVFSVERQKELFDKTSVLLKKIKCPAKLFFGDGYKGLPAFAPFDAVLVTCGAPYVPQELIDQLKTGGCLVIPVGEGASQVMHKYLKAEDGSVSKSVHGDFKFVPMLKNREGK
jgi:protein-L-isoaspartate(D-aspartate) O-methyltransferase